MVNNACVVRCPYLCCTLVPPLKRNTAFFLYKYRYNDISILPVSVRMMEVEDRIKGSVTQRTHGELLSTTYSGMDVVVSDLKLDLKVTEVGLFKGQHQL